MARPRLLRRAPDYWADPTAIAHPRPEPPYSAFILWLARLAAVLLVGAGALLVAGLAGGNEKLTWGSAALAVPAVLYLLLVYSWAWARASLDQMDYGDDPEVAVAAPRPDAALAGGPGVLRWWRSWRARHKTPTGSDGALLWRLARECRRYWAHILVVLLVSLVSTPIFLLSPLPLKIAVDSVLKDLPLPAVLRDTLPSFFQASHVWLLVVAVLLQVVVAFFSQIQSLVQNILSVYAGEKMSLDLRSRMFRHAQRLSLAFHDTRGPSDSAYRVQYDSTAVQAVTIGGFIPIVAAGFTLVTAMVVSAKIDWQLTCVALAVAPLLFMSSQRFKNQMRPHYTGVKVLESNALGVVQEVLTSIRVVKAFGREDGEQKRFEDVSKQGIKAKVRLALAEGIFGTIASTAVSIGAAAVLFVGVRHVQTGVLTLGELLVVMGYTAQLFKPLRTFTKQMGRLQSSLASVQRSFELLDQEPEVTDAKDALPLRHAMGEIEFHRVSFSYDGEKKILDDVSFHIDPGATVGIAGRTGAGKSTLLSLIMRFYEPSSGAVRLDGRDIRDYRVADVRSQYALVLQEPVLFSTTIADNIRYGRPDASMKDVVAAAVAANAHDFIERMPAGYDTPVGERGMKLSGGERQRISLARAFLKNASVLVLDEPTSSVDVRTEAEIMEAMQRLMEGRTTLMIAHRLATLENCDLILFVDGGHVKVAEPQTLTELMTSIDLEAAAAGEQKVVVVDEAETHAHR